MLSFYSLVVSVSKPEALVADGIFVTSYTNVMLLVQ